MDPKRAHSRDRQIFHDFLGNSAPRDQLAAQFAAGVVSIGTVSFD
jgi:hypothetical protein